MVFFIVACHLPDKEEEQIGQTLKQQISNQGSRALGELYEVEVSTFLLDSGAGGQEKVQNWNSRLINGVEWDSH